MITLLRYRVIKRQEAVRENIFNITHYHNIYKGYNRKKINTTQEKTIPLIYT